MTSGLQAKEGHWTATIGCGGAVAAAGRGGGPHRGCRGTLGAHRSREGAHLVSNYINK